MAIPMGDATSGSSTSHVGHRPLPIPVIPAYDNTPGLCGFDATVDGMGITPGLSDRDSAVFGDLTAALLSAGSYSAIPCSYSANLDIQTMLGQNIPPIPLHISPGDQVLSTADQQALLSMYLALTTQPTHDASHPFSPVGSESTLVASSTPQNSPARSMSTASLASLPGRTARSNIKSSALSAVSKSKFHKPPSSLTPEERAECISTILSKRERNSQAAKKLRVKKRREAIDLQGRIKELERQNAELAEKLEAMQTILAGYQKE